jgi:hypothetical protein
LDTFSALGREVQLSTQVAQRALTLLKGLYQRHAKPSPEQLAQLIEANGLPVYLVKTAQSRWMLNVLLKSLGYSYGFIPNDHSDRYRTLVGALSKLDDKLQCPPLISKGLHVYGSEQFNLGMLVHQFYHGLACQAGMAGYTEASLKLYAEFLGKHGGELPEGLGITAEDALALRHAVRRDSEALQFVRLVMETFFAPSNQGAAFRQSGKAFG